MIDRDNRSEQALVHSMENLGYDLLPKSHSNSPGYTGLIVAIREAATKRHYDPESIRLQLSDSDNMARGITLKLNSHLSELTQVCPGPVVLNDRFDKPVSFFTFGGQLETTIIPGERLYSLYSPAPVLEFTKNLESFPDQLASEVEVLLAAQHAMWGKNDQGFAGQLAQIDPFQFYLASLNEILTRYRQSRNLREGWPGFYPKLLKEKEWLMQAGQWPPQLTSLEDLLAPDPIERD